MCCVCNLLCKLISLAVSILFIIAVVLLILWGVGIIFQNDNVRATVKSLNVPSTTWAATTN